MVHLALSSFSNFHFGLDEFQLMTAPAHATEPQVQATPSKVAQPQGAGGSASDDGGIDSDLQARLDNLRKM